MHSKQYLDTAGLKATQPRLSVLSLLKRHDKPIDVPHLLSDLEEKHMDIDQATVYRMLETFLQKGLVKRIDLGEGKFRYELSRGEHHHFICERCGHIEDIADCTITVLEKEISEKKGVLVTRHSLEFFGLCKDCQS